MSQFQSESCANTPIKVQRVFDSCSDRDCFSNVQIIMDGGELPSNITMVKSRCVRVSDICMTIEPVPFNRGFYSIDLTYTFRVELMAYERSCSSPVLLTGTAYTNKNVILYGGESNTKTFFSNGGHLGDTNACCETVNLPTAAVQVVDPITLEARIGTVCITENTAPTRTVIMTLGLFSVVELFRPVTVLVPTYAYTIPIKECHADTESPCAVFDKIRFPAEEFTTSGLPIDAINTTHTKECGCDSETEIDYITDRSTLE
ncbi:MAG: hypothetical protein LUF89_02560 [Ruminococcus sp.]|nr:hypothetical protein [Ruminococcus sp.]